MSQLDQKPTRWPMRAQQLLGGQGGGRLGRLRGARSGSRLIRFLGRRWRSALFDDAGHHHKCDPVQASFCVAAKTNEFPRNRRVQKVRTRGVDSVSDVVAARFVGYWPVSIIGAGSRFVRYWEKSRHCWAGSKKSL